MADPAPYQIEQITDPITKQTIVKVTGFGQNSNQYVGTFVSSAGTPSAAQPTVLTEVANIAPIVQAAVASPTVAPGDLPAVLIPVPAGDFSAAQDILDTIAFTDSMVPAATNA
jgi:hypothetical protein